MNEALFTLTIATVVMMPAQFLAGVFGMNFQKGMSILEWKHGYMMFWLISGSCVIASLALATTCLTCRKRRLQERCCSKTVTCCLCRCRASKRIDVHGPARIADRSTLFVAASVSQQGYEVSP